MGGSAAAVAGKYVEASLKGEAAASKDLGIAAVGGAVGGAVGAKIANSATAQLERAAASKEGVVSAVATTTTKAIRESGPVQVKTTVGSEMGQKGADLGATLGQKHVEEKLKQ